MTAGTSSGGDVDSAGVYFISVEEFESRTRPGERDSHGDEEGTGDASEAPEVELPPKR